MQIGNIECLFVVHLLSHEWVFGVGGYLGHFLLWVFLKIYADIIFFVGLRWKLDVLSCGSRKVVDALARAVEALVDALFLLLA